MSQLDSEFDCLKDVGLFPHSKLFLKVGNKVQPGQLVCDTMSIQSLWQDIFLYSTCAIGVYHILGSLTLMHCFWLLFNVLHFRTNLLHSG